MIMYDLAASITPIDRFQVFDNLSSIKLMFETKPLKPLKIRETVSGGLSQDLHALFIDSLPTSSQSKAKISEVL